MSENITPLSNMTDQGADQKTFYYISLSLQVIICIFGVLANAVLSYSQIKFTNWPFTPRLLFLNLTAASALAAVVHSIESTYQLLKFSWNGNGRLQEGEFWLDMFGDIALTGIAVGIDILALQNLLALRQCDSQLNNPHPERRSDQKTPVAKISMMVAFGWILSAILVYFRLNPQSQIYDKEHSVNASVYVSFILGLVIELSVILVIWMTRRTLSRLQVDFEIRRAQQTLDMRTHIKETIKMTSMLFGVLIAHIVVWVLSLAAGFGFNQYLAGADLGGSPVAYDNQTTAFTSIVDTITLAFNVLYPLVIIRLEPRLLRRLACCASAEVHSSEYSTKRISDNGASNLPSGGAIQPASVHHNAIESHWQRVAQVQFDVKASSPRAQHGKGGKDAKVATSLVQKGPGIRHK